ncbi:MAG: hypothetical protein HYX38_35270 [Rhodospirillales bacterium]|nr:hypothetical protein [Rhodospirillales bacterium]
MAAETETVSEAAPESIDVAGAVALLDDASPAEDVEREPEPAPEVEQDGPADESEADVEMETEPQVAVADEAPEFWNADDKAAWQDVPEALRPMLRKYEQQRIAFVNEKTREAAQVREESLRVAQGAVGVVEQAAAWWRQNGPVFQQAFADKWSQVDWNKLAADNPAEWARLKQQRDHEATLLLEANRRGEAEIAIANERAGRAFIEARQVEHAKLAKKLPEYFGPDVAAKTYGDLGSFLSAKGISPDRINGIHEAPIIELALAAMRFEQAQKQASTVRTSSSNGAATAINTAKTTPTRVAPGPAPSALARAGNRQGEAARQVGERFRKSGGASIADAAELIRLSGL